MSMPLTFLFTDLENSTRLWEQYPELMRPTLARHDELIQMAVLRHDGRVVKSTGDGWHIAFESVTDAVAAALEAQQVLTVQS